MGALIGRLLRPGGRARDKAHYIILQRSGSTPGVLQVRGGMPCTPVRGSKLAVLQGPAGAAVQVLLLRQLLMAQPRRLLLLLLLLLLLCAARAAVKRAPCKTNNSP